MSGGSERYDIHLGTKWRATHITTTELYRELYDRSINTPDEFWAEQAGKHLSWDKRWGTVVRSDFEEGQVAWFSGGIINAAYNCVDRHLERLKDVPAYHWERDNPEESTTTTYGDLYEKTNQLAALLKTYGVNRGDRVVIYMPTAPELPVAMLACARIGAVHCVVYSGFSSPSLVYRIQNCSAKVMITADCFVPGLKEDRLMQQVKATIDQCPTLEKIIVVRQDADTAQLNDDRFVWLEEALQDPALPSEVTPEPMDAEDPLFILYVSGPTGKAKGIVHTHGGYLLHAAMTTQLVFDLKDQDKLWITEDIGWMAGHTYMIYGPLLNGASSIIGQGIDLEDNPTKLWPIIERQKVTKLCTVPSAIRRVARYEPNSVHDHDLSSLEMMVFMGQTLDPETWGWTFDHISRGRFPMLNVYGQTETGGIIIAPFPAVAPLKSGACSLPFFGVKPVILDPSTGDEVMYPNQEGVLCMEKPWPGMARTIFGDHDQFIESAFSRVPGLFFTGDGAKRDEDGDYVILGRIDDVINADGRRLGIPELEATLIKHDLVTEAAVVGFPHPIKGIGVYAFVQLSNLALASDKLKEELTDQACEMIGDFAVVDLIQWVDTLPKTPSGKILRVILQKVAAGDVERIEQFAAIADPDVVQHLVKGRVKLETW